MKFKINDVSEFLEALDKVFTTTKEFDIEKGRACCLEVANDGKVLFYRDDSKIYTEAWVVATEFEPGKIVISKDALEPLRHCTGLIAAELVEPDLVFQCSFGELSTRTTSLSPDLYTRRICEVLLQKLPEHVTDILWVARFDKATEWIKFGPQFVECSLGSLAISFYEVETSFTDVPVFISYEYDHFIRAHSYMGFSEGRAWIQNGQALHRIQAAQRDDRLAFYAPIYLGFQADAGFEVKKPGLVNVLEYAKSISKTDSLSQGKCSIRYSHKENLLYVENMGSDKGSQESTSIPVLPGGFGEFDVTVFPGQLATCLASFDLEQVSIRIKEPSIRIFSAETRVSSYIGLGTDTWRIKRGNT